MKWVLNIHWKDWCWSWIQLQYTGHLMRRTDSFEDTLMLGKIKAGGKGDDREWDGWMASLIQWTWVWVNSGSWWWTGRPGVLQSMGLQRVGLNWVSELNRTVLLNNFLNLEIIWVWILLFKILIYFITCHF